MGRDRASRPEAKPWRLFVAAEVPQAVRSALATELEPLRARHPELRWTPEGNWHVTLKFLGAVWPRLVDDVRSRVARAAGATDTFETRLDGVGGFPSARRARIVWVGVADDDGRFAELAAALDGALAHLVKPEERPFTAHLTVSRAKDPVAIDDEVSRLAALRSERFRVDRIVLYRSHLRRPAPVYESVESFPFRDPGGR
jgi:2'-5' RNA ligase